jgi:ubiquinone/menaquinone biosynthesis C-methylase UbiE
MKPIDQRADLERYYRDRAVIGTYMQRRTAEPLNGVLHRRQVRFLNQVLAAAGLHAVLEIACGPGRLTAEIRRVQLGAAVDTSFGMLKAAVQRLDGEASCWSFLRTDAFALPFRSEVFDAVYTLRFVRHFQLDDRQRLYDEVRRVLRPNGLFIIDALNRDVSHPYRVRRGLEHYKIYDVLYRQGEVEGELRAAGFRVAKMEGILRHASVQRPLNRLRLLGMDRLAKVLISAVEHFPSRQPSTWMVVGQKI